MKKIVSVFLSIILLLSFAACSKVSSKKFTNIQSVYDEFMLENISEIKVVNGTTGNRASITEQEEIKFVFEEFSQLAVKNIKQPKEDSSGYTYAIGFYKDEEKILGISYGSITETLLINGHLYIIEDMSIIQSAIDYFGEIIK